MEPASPVPTESPAPVLLVIVGQHALESDTDMAPSGTDATATLRVTFADDRPEPPVPNDVDGRMGLLLVGDVLVDDTVESAVDLDDPVVVDAVRDRTDLVAIGVAVSRFCSHWSSEWLLVCVDSFDPSRHEGHVVPTPGAIFDAVVVRDGAESIVEATDDEVASVLADCNDTDDVFDVGTAPSTEASDEDIARRLNR